MEDPTNVKTTANEVTSPTGQKWINLFKFADDSFKYTVNYNVNGNTYEIFYLRPTRTTEENGLERANLWCIYQLSPGGSFQREDNLGGGHIMLNGNYAAVQDDAGPVD